MNALPREICIARPFGETYFSPISSDCSENFKFRFASFYFIIQRNCGNFATLEYFKILRFEERSVLLRKFQSLEMTRQNKNKNCSEKQKHLANDIEKMDGIGWNAGKGRRKPVKS